MSEESLKNANQSYNNEGRNAPVPATPINDGTDPADAGNLQPSLNTFDRAPHPLRNPQAQPSIADQTETHSDDSSTDPQPTGPVNPLDFATNTKSVFRTPDPEMVPDPTNLDPQKFPSDTTPNS